MNWSNSSCPVRPALYPAFGTSRASFAHEVIPIRRLYNYEEVLYTHRRDRYGHHLVDAGFRCEEAQEDCCHDPNSRQEAREARQEEGCERRSENGAVRRYSSGSCFSAAFFIKSCIPGHIVLGRKPGRVAGFSFSAGPRSRPGPRLLTCCLPAYLSNQTSSSFRLEPAVRVC